MSSYFLDVLLNVSTKGNSKHLYGVTLALVAVSLSIFYASAKNGFFGKLKKAHRQLKLMERFPGLKRIPVIGSSFEIYQLVWTPCQDVLPWIRQMTEKYGKTFKLWVIGNQPKLMTADSEIGIYILQHENIRAKPTEAIAAGKACNSEGLLTVEPEVHSVRRKQWSQWLTRKTIDRSLSTFRKQAVKFSKILEQFDGTGKEFEITEYAISCTLRAITTSAFGEEIVGSIPDSVVTQYHKDLHTFSYTFAERSFRPWLNNDWIYFHLTPSGRECLSCINRGNELTQNAIKERKLQRRNGTAQKEGTIPCFLDHLLDLVDKGQLEENQVVQELNVFVVAGYDTTGLTICYTLYLLSLHPEHQDKAVEELVALFGQNIEEVEEITPGQIREMKYVELCIKESLRLFPIAPVAFRRTTGDVVLPDGRTIPEDVDVYVVLQQILKDPKYFPDPEIFIPSRHSAPITAFIPFALGARNCIGQVFAMQEIKMILAHLLLKYKWECTEKGPLDFIMTTFLVPENGIHFKIEKRFHE